MTLYLKIPFMKKFLIPLLFSLSLITGVFAQDSEKGPTVLITGANRGLGLEFAKQFSEKGYTVIGTARSPEKATELKELGAEVMKLDVTSEDDIAALATSLKDRRIDILLNNAGYFGPKLMREEGVSTFRTIKRGEMEDCLRVNTLGPLFVSQALLPNLELSDNPKIITISSRYSIIGDGTNVAWGYGVSKTAVNRVIQNMHKALHKDGFIVLALAPGHNKTDMGTDAGDLEPKDSIGKMIPLIENLTKEQSGKFLYYTGKELPW